MRRPRPQDREMPRTIEHGRTCMPSSRSVRDAYGSGQQEGMDRPRIRPAIRKFTRHHDDISRDIEWQKSLPGPGMLLEARDAGRERRSPDMVDVSTSDRAGISTRVECEAEVQAISGNERRTDPTAERSEFGIGGRRETHT